MNIHLADAISVEKGVKMRQGQSTTQNELLKDGWSLVDVSGVYEVWSKGNDVLLFDPVRKKVHRLHDTY